MPRFFTFLYIGALAFASSVSGCRQGFVYEQALSLPADGWAANKVLVYKLRIDDPSKPLDVGYGVRYSSAYPFYNFYIKYEIVDSAGAPVAMGQHQLQLLNAETGRPLGSGLGGVFDRDFSVFKGMRFKNPGLYQYRITQYMRRDPLPGIQAFSLKVEAGG